MSDVILIRGDTIAFPESPGDYGEGHDLYIQHDLIDLITDFGLFLPIIEHGVQVIPFLRKKYKGTMKFESYTKFDQVLADTPFVFAEGTKGVLIAPYEDSVEFMLVRMTVGNKIALAPLRTGLNGHAVIGEYKHLNSQMAAAVKLTKDIRDSVAMYCRHSATTPVDHYLYWTKEEATAFLKKHSKLYEEEK